MTAATPPDIVRAAYAELVVTDLERSRWFWVDLLGFVVTRADTDALYLRGYDELGVGGADDVRGHRQLHGQAPNRGT